MFYQQKSCLLGAKEIGSEMFSLRNGNHLPLLFLPVSFPFTWKELAKRRRIVSKLWLTLLLLFWITTTTARITPLVSLFSFFGLFGFLSFFSLLVERILSEVSLWGHKQFHGIRRKRRIPLICAANHRHHSSGSKGGGLLWIGKVVLQETALPIDPFKLARLTANASRERQELKRAWKSIIIIVVKQQW